MRRYIRKTRMLLAAPQAGFMLWEIIIGLTVFGVIAGIGMKMWRVVDQGRFTRTMETISSTINGLRHYRAVNSVLPQENQISEIPLSPATTAVWTALFHDQWIDHLTPSQQGKDQYPRHALGGGLGLVRRKNPSGIWLWVGKEENAGLNAAVLTPKEAEQLSRIWGDGTAHSETFIATEGQGHASGQCVEGKYFANHHKRTCIVQIFVCD
jgi:hypothetical protein